MNIKEITRRAGVSSATISRVPNNSGCAKEEIRQKALKAVDEYNYVPSTIAKSLSIQDSLSVGTIISDIENEFFSRVINGISEVAKSHHYSIVFLGTSETSEREHDSLKIVESQGLKGVIITPTSETDTATRDYLLRLGELGIPVVLVDRDVKRAQSDGVFTDNQRGPCGGIVALIEAGHERTAIIIGPEASKPGKDRYQGHPQTVENSGLSVPEECVACDDLKTAKAYECTEWFLGLKEPPTVIFMSSNLSTLGCLKYPAEHETKIGRNVSLVGFDGINALWMIDYRVSVMDRDAREQGREAMRLLWECFGGSGKSRQRGKRITIPYKVIPRGSKYRKTT